MHKLFTICLLLLPFLLSAQTPDLVHNEGITRPVHQANIGKITFMGKAVPIEKYTEKDFLKSFELSDKNELNIRVFMGNSLTNYLHALAPEVPAQTLVQKGNYQFAFSVDGNLIYTENLNAGAGSPDSKNTQTVFRVPLISPSNEDSWGRFLWNRFMMNGGQTALGTGNHVLKIEIRPYLKVTELQVGDLIAGGQIQIKVPKIVLSEKQIAVQKIKPKSGWVLSTDTVNSSRIRALNQQIGEQQFKDITSIVVIKDGQLLLEEYFNGADRSTLHDTRSVGKSFASALTGLAIADGYLTSEDQPIRDFYKLTDYQNYHPAKENITIKNLLTMRVPLQGSDMQESSPGNEENMYPTQDWVKFTLDLPVDSAKVTAPHWDYFTAGVVVLGDVLNMAFPVGLKFYAEYKFFKPLGIRKYKWQNTPNMIPNTAGSLQMNALDLAKFGQLYKNGGRYKEKQILTKEWVDKSLSHQVALPDSEDEYYGYLFWNKIIHTPNGSYEVYYASGNGGNEIFIFKDQPLVIVVTATAFNKPYAHRQVDAMLKQYLIPAVLK